MNASNEQPFACKGECPQCSRDRGRRTPQCASSTGPLKGRRLVLAALLAFLLPLASAAAGAGIVSVHVQGELRDPAMTVTAILAAAGVGFVSAGWVRRLGRRACSGEEIA
jgi:hypothetical protein